MHFFGHRGGRGGRQERGGRGDGGRGRGDVDGRGEGRGEGCGGYEGRGGRGEGCGGWGEVFEAGFSGRGDGREARFGRRGDGRGERGEFGGRGERGFGGRGQRGFEGRGGRGDFDGRGERGFGRFGGRGGFIAERFGFGRGRGGFGPDGAAFGSGGFGFSRRDLGMLMRMKMLQAMRHGMGGGRGRGGPGDGGPYGGGGGHGFGGHGGGGGFGGGPFGGRGGSVGRGGRGGFGDDGLPGGGRKFNSEDLQLLLLEMLAEAPRHGYELIKALEQRSGGVYAPSPGMVYPALTYLEELGYATVETEGNRKRYSLSDEGRKYLEANCERVDLLAAKLKLFAKKAEMVRRALAGESADEQGAPWVTELIEARRGIKRALLLRMDASEDEQRRIAAILKRAAEEIESQPAQAPRREPRQEP